MFAELVGLGISWFVAVLSNFKELLPERLGKRGKQIIAALLLLAATVASAVSLTAVIEHHNLKEVGQMPVASARHVQEASGATLWNSPQGPATLVVDDEVAAVVRLQSDGRGNFGYVRHYWLREPGGDGEKVKDLEGLAASADGRFIYAVTSHSYAMDPKDKDDEREEKRTRRSFAIRGCIPNPGTDSFLILDKVPLTAAFEAAVVNGRTAAAFAVPYRAESDLTAQTMKIGMEVEGLAADNRNLYFGFRAPVDVHGRAIVAKVPIDKLFPGRPSCGERPIQPTRLDPRDVEVLALPIHVNGSSYGIVSMEFERGTGQMILVANSTEPFVGFRPQVCRWRPEQAPSCDFLPDTKQPYWGKQEALVLGAPHGKATIFIDGDKGLGGWVTYERGDLGL